LGAPVAGHRPGAAAALVVTLAAAGGMIFDALIPQAIEVTLFYMGVVLAGYSLPHPKALARRPARRAEACRRSGFPGVHGPPGGVFLNRTVRKISCPGAGGGLHDVGLHPMFSWRRCSNGG